MTKPDLSIVLPCYNESRNIPFIVERLSKHWTEINFELILVNNGSTDDTDKVLKRLKKKYENIRVVTIEKNIGYGYGIMSGLRAARADFVAYSHADIQTPPEDVIKAFKIIREASLDRKLESVLIKGKRINRREEEQFLTDAYTKIAYVMLGYKIYDVNGQPKLFHKKLLDKLTRPPLDFSFDLYLLYKAIQNGYEIKTFPVDFGLRIHGESKWASSPAKKCKTILGYLKNILLISLQNIPDSNNPIRQFIRFSLVGLFGVSVNYGTFYFLYKISSVYYVFSSLAGYFLAGIIIFFMNRRWTFNVKYGDVTKQYFLFFLLVNFTFLLNGISIFFLTEIMHIIPEISQTITMLITITINFLGTKFWVFKK